MLLDNNCQTRDSAFLNCLSMNYNKKVYFEPLRGNNGDALILKGAKRVLRKARCTLVEHPESAQLILINGGGAVSDVWGGATVRVIEDYRRRFPNLPIVVGPSTYRFQGIDFAKVLEIIKSPLTLFARERISAQLLGEINLPTHVAVRISQDFAFELQDSDFIKDLLDKCQENHVLIAMRKDREGSAGILAKTRGTRLPQRIRRPLSRIRDRLIALRSQNVIEEIIKEERIPKNTRRIYRDVSVSVSFEDFIASICDAALIITDRLHVGILGHMLKKRVVLRGGGYHKIKGVYELSMSGSGSRTRLYQ